MHSGVRLIGLVGVLMFGACTSTSETGPQGEALVQGPRGPVIAAPVPGPQSRWRVIDTVQTSIHHADVVRDPDGWFIVELDSVALGPFGPADRVDNDLFVPQQIAEIFDLPDEVIIIIQGQSQSCGLRYNATFFLRNGGTSQFFGTCGFTYNLSVSANTILATQAGAADPEIYYIANSRALGPIHQSALNILDNEEPAGPPPSIARPAPTPPSVIPPATNNASVGDIIEMIKVAKQIYTAWKIYESRGAFAVAGYWIALVSVQVASQTFCHSPTLQSEVDKFSPEVTSALKEALECSNSSQSMDYYPI